MHPRELLARTVEGIRPVDPAWRTRAEERQATLTKPPGSLGRLEEVAVRLCAIQETLAPVAAPREIVVFAADHGVAAEGVSAYPPEVTAQMVANFTHGGAAINALAEEAGASVRVVDVGVRGPVRAGGQVPLFSLRVRAGTANIAHGPAMSEGEALEAAAVGIRAALDAAQAGVAVLGLGEMGIANTTAASAVTAAITGLAPARVTGRGTGVADARLVHKTSVVERALAVNRPRGDDPLDVLHKVGGLEIAALCGFCLGGAAQRRVLVVDGFIATAAALLATAFAPAAGDYLLAGHLSPERGHAVQLERLRQRPLLDLGMRLGEGTGAALAMNVIAAAVAAFNRMATFASAGVSGRA